MCHWSLPSLGIACARNPVIGLEPWRGLQTWRSTWRLQSYSAWWSTGQTCWRVPAHHTQCTACGSWLWRGHRSTAYPRKHSTRKRQRERVGKGKTKRAWRELLQGKARMEGSPAGMMGRQAFLWWITEPLPNILSAYPHWVTELCTFLFHFLFLQPFHTLFSLSGLSASAYLALFLFPFAKWLFASAWKKPRLALFTEV